PTLSARAVRVQYPVHRGRHGDRHAAGDRGFSLHAAILHARSYSGSDQVMHPVLLFVPLDGRPVTMDIVVDLGLAAGVDVPTPERSLLRDRFRPGEVDRLWDCLELPACGWGTA